MTKKQAAYVTGKLRKIPNLVHPGTLKLLKARGLAYAIYCKPEPKGLYAYVLSFKRAKEIIRSLTADAITKRMTK